MKDQEKFSLKTPPQKMNFRIHFNEKFKYFLRNPPYQTYSKSIDTKATIKAPNTFPQVPKKFNNIQHNIILN